jgi:hypothetical protein
MRRSKQLPNHKAQYPLYSDREYVAFEASSVRTDMATAVAFFREAVPEPRTKAILVELENELTKLPADPIAINKILDTARQNAWNLHGSLHSTKANAVLMLTNFLAGLTRLVPKDTSK